MVVDPAPDDIWPTDDAPGPDAGMPPDAGPDDGASPQARNESPPAEAVGSWRASGPRRSRRSPDLPLFDPPAVSLHGVRDGDVIHLRLDCPVRAISTRWEGDGEVDGDGREARWVPGNDTDQVRVGVRSAGGVVVATLRAREVQRG